MWIIPGMCPFIIVLQALRIADTSYLRWFFCAFPMIFGMIAITGWGMLLALLMGVEMFHAATAGETIRIRKAQREKAFREREQRDKQRRPGA